jgi:hypothetical protein
MKASQIVSVGTIWILSLPVSAKRLEGRVSETETGAKVQAVPTTSPSEHPLPSWFGIENPPAQQQATQKMPGSTPIPDKQSTLDFVSQDATADLGTVTLHGIAQQAEVCGLDANAQQRCWDIWYERFERALDSRLCSFRQALNFNGPVDVVMSMAIYSTGNIEVRSMYRKDGIGKILGMRELLAYKLAIKSLAHSGVVKFPAWTHRKLVLDDREIGAATQGYTTGQYETIKTDE